MVMLGSAYYAIYISPSLPPIGVFLIKLAIFTIATIGIASFGYVINDLTDVKQDLRSGHYNIMARHDRLGRSMILVFVVLLGTLPWIWLPRSPLILILLALEYGLFLAYSVPPVRLKSRGLLGPIADSIYAYVLPSTIAALVASDGEAGPAFVLYIIVFVAWCFLFGLVGILKHQLFDCSRDRLDNIRTFVVIHGWDAAFDATVKLANAALVAYLLLMTVQGHANFFIFLGFCVHLSWQLCNWDRHAIVATRLSDSVSRPDRFHLLYDQIIGDFCWYWHPLIILILLSLRSSDYLILLIAHLLVLPNGIKRMVLE